MILTPNEYATVLRTDFMAFLERSFYELNPQTRFLPNWHIELMAAKLEASRRGTSRRVILNVPPRSLKSHCASIAFSAWVLGHNPAAHIVNVSYGQDLADKLARDARALMQTDWYQRLFPATRLSPEKMAVNEFETTSHGGRIATSVGGVLTGRGADYFILDDPLKPSDAVSEAQRRAVNDWYDSTLCSRLDDKARGVVIIVMQRLHEDDLVGHVLAKDAWEVLSFPAIAEHDESFLIESPWGTRRHTRRVGDLLHPERESHDTLERLRRAMGEYNFAGQYQQAPAPFGGGMVKQEWFQVYEPHQLPDSFDEIIQSWDTANKKTELSNYSVCTTWGIKLPRIYLLHVLRNRLLYPELKRAIHEQKRLWNATVLLIEDRASGTPLVQDLVHEGLTVKPVDPVGDKVMRMSAQTATIENRFVYLPKEAPWLAEYLHELTTFDKGKHDDQVDSTSQALAWIKESQSTTKFSWDCGFNVPYDPFPPFLR